MSGRSSYLVGRAFRSFLLASVLTAAASQLGNLIDGLMLSRFIGEGAMSAVNISTPVTQAMFALCILLGVGGSMLAGMAIGNHRRDEASQIFSQVTSATVILGASIAVVGMIFLTPLVSMLCPDMALREYTGDYLRVIMPSAPLYMLMVVTQTFVTLDGEPRRVSLAVVTGAVVNLALDYLLIVPFGMGVTGAALATLASYVAALCVLVPHFRKPGALLFRFRGRLPYIKDVVRMGVPFGIATVLIAVQMLGNNIVAMRLLGSAGIVTLSVCMYMLSFSMIILTGTLESFQPVAAILKGLGDNRGVALVLGRAYAFLACALTLFALVLVLFPGWIISMFGIGDANAVEMMRMALPAFAFNIIFQCAVYLLIPVYQLYGHRSLSLFISFGQPLMPVIGFAVMSFMASRGVEVNPWWGFALGQLSVILIVAPFALMRRDRHVPFVLIPHENPEEIFDVTIAANFNDMQQRLLEADAWLRERGVEESLRNRVIVSLEESVKNVIQHGFYRQRRTMIDLRLAIDSVAIRGVVHDEGRPFNPLAGETGSGFGLLMMRNLSDDARYEYLFHQNMLHLEWKLRMS